MKNRALVPCYVNNVSNDIWSRPDYNGIAYSDGDEAESRTFIELALRAADYTPTNEDITRFTELESVIQQQVAGCPTQKENWWLEQLLPTSSQAVAKRDAQIMQREIADIHPSTSWRMTSLVRWVRSLTAIENGAN